MATKSTLKAMQDLHSAVNDPPGGWTTDEALVEVLLNGFSGATSSIDKGILQAVPAGSTNGDVMPNRPSVTRGFTLYLDASSGSMTGYFQDKGFTPSGVPDSTITYGPFDGAGIVDVPQASGNRTFFVTATTGTNQFIWV